MYFFTLMNKYRRRRWNELVSEVKVEVREEKDRTRRVKAPEILLRIERLRMEGYYEVLAVRTDNIE
jgi:hypothetical protein